MEDISLLIDLHKNNLRQGPGGLAETQLALSLSRTAVDAPLKIADIGCGTGASTMALARSLPQSHIVAVDFLQEFIDVLRNNADAAGFGDRITTMACSMDALPFADEEFDLVWSEGAIYNMGFEAGLKAWRRFLKPGGVMAVSEITWLTQTRPEEIQSHWVEEYPEIDVASAKIAMLEKHGYSPIGYLTLPESCWLENYYHPIQHSLKDFLDRNSHSAEAQAIASAEQEELALYQKYKNYYSYGFYLAKRVDKV
ncbi:MAG: class I SAM-dependent methyltransferase [Wenzhouxiangella sp.]|jgi:ubiquinone/menaquinone biosynthesis C-methylase UbiE|nr:class I SAM-dependent methyltransferase [Wenzhouxiangella sp.]